MRVLRRTLAGYAQHPNFAAILIVGLGWTYPRIPTVVVGEL